MQLQNVKGVWLPSHETHLLEFAKEENWTYQKHKLDKAMEFVKKRDVCIDIGAHCGLWSMHLSKLFGFVYAFEPIPLHRECFRKNVTDENVFLVPCALGDEQKEVFLATKETSSGDTHIAADGTSALMLRLDSFELEPDFIKIDTEGYELFILRGAEKTIEKYHPAIIVEQKPGKAENFGLGRTEAVGWLEKRGYKLRDVIAGDYILDY